MIYGLTKCSLLQRFWSLLCNANRRVLLICKVNNLPSLTPPQLYPINILFLSVTRVDAHECLLYNFAIKLFNSEAVTQNCLISPSARDVKISLQCHHHHRQPWAQCPLVSDAIVTIAAHRCLSRAAWLNSCWVVPHHCSMSSDHSR